MTFKYARTSLPFDFLGHMSESQKKEFYAWMDKKKPKFTPIQEWWQIHAHRLRKTAGVLEKFYKEKAEDSVQPTFEKTSWSPHEQGHFNYVMGDDHIPGVTMSRLKNVYKFQLQVPEEGVFWMNWLRNHIEKYEDKAQFMKEATKTEAELRKELDGMFAQPAYEAVLVRDTTNTYKGESKYRVHQLDPPTIFEKEQFSHMSDKSISLKMPDGAP